MPRELVPDVRHARGYTSVRIRGFHELTLLWQVATRRVLAVVHVVHHHLPERVQWDHRGGEPLEPEAGVPLADEPAGVPVNAVRNVFGPVRLDPRVSRRIL